MLTPHLFINIKIHDTLKMLSICSDSFMFKSSKGLSKCIKSNFNSSKIFWMNMFVLCLKQYNSCYREIPWYKYIQTIFKEQFMKLSVGEKKRDGFYQLIKISVY